MRLTLTTDEGVVVDQWSIVYDKSDAESFDVSKGMARQWVENEIHESIKNQARYEGGDA